MQHGEPIMTKSLIGKIAIVTGGAEGIGKGIALSLAKSGATLVIADLNEEKAISTKLEINKLSPKSAAMKVDVAKKTEIEECVTRVISEFGQVDILVNNAGIYTDDWEASLSINIMGVVNFCESTIPHMQSREYGKIINIGSMSAHAARNLGGPYPTSKAAVLRYTKGLAYELRNNNINVNAVCPGAVWTSFQKGLQAQSIENDETIIDTNLYDSFLQKYSDVIPMGRPQTTDDIGHTVEFLSSDSSKNITGQCIHVDGGAILRD